ncbi:CvpA family protein [Gracilimonas mengyeensis]|uniref:Membrane protein required for colicin V production n=1 Tax=Gracilimonas mengyeensis TaxID=1302730 RepID=A0A521CR57_9BACT|nr:CvpA family protein [Gracilimonas mengyeensis]SMO61959.1 membrane protein required for colicin V production [Gracilimonas mengyeensis]
MSVLDLIIGIPILYFGYRGVVNGLVKEILNIVAIILAVFLTFNYMDALAGIIAPFFEEGASYVPFVSGALIFLGTLIVVALIAWGTKELLEAVNLSLVNRIFGALFGALKSGVVVSAILLLLAGFNIPSEQTREESYLYPAVIYIAPMTYNAIASIYPGAENYTETLKKNIGEYNPLENIPFLNDN